MIFQTFLSERQIYKGTLLSNDDGSNMAENEQQNNRPARAFYILVYFFAVLLKTTKWNDLI